MVSLKSELTAIASVTGGQYGHPHPDPSPAYQRMYYCAC